MENQHVTTIDEDLDPDTPTGHRYQARCVCLWVGVQTFDRKRAVKDAEMHRSKAAVDSL